MEIQINLDNLTLGDLEELESGNFTRILSVFDHVVRFEGVPDEELPDALRRLPWTAIKDITEAVRDAVEKATNPVISGKN